MRLYWTLLHLRAVSVGSSITCRAFSGINLCYFRQGWAFGIPNLKGYESFKIRMDLDLLSACFILPCNVAFWSRGMDSIRKYSVCSVPGSEGNSRKKYPNALQELPKTDWNVRFILFFSGGGSQLGMDTLEFRICRIRQFYRTFESENISCDDSLLRDRICVLLDVRPISDLNRATFCIYR